MRLVRASQGKRVEKGARAKTKLLCFCSSLLWTKNIEPLIVVSCLFLARPSHQLSLLNFPEGPSTYQSFRVFWPPFSVGSVRAPQDIPNYRQLRRSFTQTLAEEGFEARPDSRTTYGCPCAFLGQVDRCSTPDKP